MFRVGLEVLNLYIKSPYILKYEKYFLQLFKDKVMNQLKKSINKAN